MTPEELAEIEERCRKATAGPWRTDLDPIVVAEEGTQYDEWDYDPATVKCSDEDREFIAHARADVPALCAEVRKWREAWTAMNAAADRFCADWKNAEAEVARLREALDAAQRIVKRKADREAGREET